MNRSKKSIKPGIYLVVDPAMEEHTLLDKLTLSLTKKIAAVQIWDNFKNVQDIDSLIQKICKLCAEHKTPVLINNQWEYLKTIELDGVHFDVIPNNLQEIKKQVNKNIVVGLTCGNNLQGVKWAEDNDIDYISFCSMFPSPSVTNCEIITHDTISKAALIFSKAIFLAGGINLKNIKQLEALKYDGIAVISGIMNEEYPDQAIDEYCKNLKPLK